VLVSILTLLSFYHLVDGFSIQRGKLGQLCLAVFDSASVHFSLSDDDQFQPKSKHCNKSQRSVVSHDILFYRPLSSNLKSGIS
jgi:uncharacterized protein (DUF2141 family)